MNVYAFFVTIHSSANPPPKFSYMLLLPLFWQPIYILSKIICDEREFFIEKDLHLHKFLRQ